MAVEKLPFRPKQPKIEDRKCLGNSRRPLISHPDAILFLRFSRQGVFQQPQAITPTTPVAGGATGGSECNGDVSPIEEAGSLRLTMKSENA